MNLFEFILFGVCSDFCIFAFSLSSRKNGGVEDVCSSSPVRTPKSQLPAKQTSTEECWNPPKNATLHPWAKEEPQQDDRGGAITFRIKPRTCQRCSEGTNKTLVYTRTQGQEQ